MTNELIRGHLEFKPYSASNENIITTDSKHDNERPITSILKRINDLENKVETIEKFLTEKD